MVVRVNDNKTITWIFTCFQLVSTCQIVIVTYHWIILPVELYATLIGPIRNPGIFWIWCFLQSFFMSWMVVALMTHITLKVFNYWTNH